MKFALLSDIHANLPALQAVLDDVERRGIANVYQLGDLVGYGPWPNETVQVLVERGIKGIAGNYDSTVATGYKHCGCHYDDPRQVELAHLSFQWTLANTSDATKAILGALPFRLDIAPFGGHVGGTRIVLVHGTPTLNTMYWTEDRSDEFCLSMAQKSGVRPGDLIAFGHTHLPWKREVGGIHFVNTGSVGRPKDGDPRAGYVIVDIQSGVHSVEHIRVGYDVEATARAIRSSSLPSEFADYLLTGGKVVDEKA